MALTVPAPPEQGQLIDVRQRRYVVTDVLCSALPDNALRVPGHGIQYVMLLASVDNDAFGETLHGIGVIVL